MSPGDHLNRSKPPKREEIGEWVHADIGEEHDVQSGGVDRAADPAEIERERHVAVGAFAYGFGQVVRLRGDGEHVDFETVARQIADEAERRPTDRVRVEISRNEADAQPARGKRSMRAFGSCRIHRPADPRDLAQQLGVVAAVVGEIEGGRADLEFGVRHLRRFQAEQFVQVAVEPLPYPIDLFARLEDDGKHQRAAQPRSGSGVQRRVSVHEAPRLLDVRVFAHHGETEESVAVSGVDVEDFPVPLLRLALPVAILERGGQAQHRARPRRVGRRKDLQRAGEV